MNERAEAHERARERLLPSLWAERHRVMNEKPWSFAGYEYLRDIHDDTSRRIVVEKGAQLGFTEALQNRLVHSIDFKVDAMVVFPTDDTARRHSKARFKALLDTSPYIASIFREVDAVDVKRSLDTALYFEGSNSGDALYSVPVGLLVVDEVNRCSQNALAAADYRLDGHANAVSLRVSTPTTPDFGVSAEYKESDQKRWYVHCPDPLCFWSGPLSGDTPELERWSCITWSGFPAIPHQRDEVKVAHSARICCPECRTELSEAQRRRAVSGGSWVATNPGAKDSGYSINQLCSPTQSAEAIVGRYFRALRDPNPESLRQFINQALGMSWLGTGEEITIEMVRDLVIPARARTHYGLCLGADVGKVLDVAQGDRDDSGRLVVARFLQLPGFDALEKMIRDEGILRAVVDRYPEASKTEELCDKFPSVVYRAEHPEGMKQMYVWDVHRQVVQIREVDAVDVLLTRIRRKTALIERRDLWELATDHWSRINTSNDIDAKGRPVRRVLHKIGGRDDMALAAIYLDAASSLVSATGTAVAWAEDAGVARDAGEYGHDHSPTSRRDHGGGTLSLAELDCYDDDLARWERF